MSARLLLAATGVFAVLLVPPTAAPRTVGSADSCPHANTQPGDASLKTLRGAIRCVLNAERGLRGLTALRHNKRLGRAATAHSRSMVRHRYFSHDEPGGRNFAERIKRSGYVSGARLWEAGENLAWGERENATPAAIVGSWMSSGQHRRNLLDKGFEQVGIGIRRGTPSGPAHDGRASKLVVTADFGLRR